MLDKKEQHKALNKNSDENKSDTFKCCSRSYVTQRRKKESPFIFMMKKSVLKIQYIVLTYCSDQMMTLLMLSYKQHVATQIYILQRTFSFLGRVLVNVAL